MLCLWLCRNTTEYLATICQRLLIFKMVSFFFHIRPIIFYVYLESFFHIIRYPICLKTICLKTAEMKKVHRKYYVQYINENLMTAAGDAQPGCYYTDNVLPAYKQLSQFWFGKLTMSFGMARNTLHYLNTMKISIMHGEIKKW